MAPPIIPPDNPGDHGIATPGSGGLTDAELRATPVDVAVIGEIEVKNDAGNPIPVNDAGGSLTVDGPLTDAELRATPVPVSGTVNLGTVPEIEIKNDAGSPITINGTVTANAGVGPWPVTDNGGSLTVDGPLTDVQLRATPVPVSGTVTIADGSGPVTVDGTVSVNQPVAVTDNGGSLTVDGAVTVNNAAGASAVNIQDGGNSITVDGTVTANAGTGTFAVSGPLTDAQLRATAVPVSGTVSLTNDPTKLEDAAHTSGDRGNFILGVRNDSNVTLTNADGDYSPVATDLAGRIKLSVTKSEDAPHVSGDAGIPLWGVRNDTVAIQTSADGDYSPLSVDRSGRLLAVLSPSISGGLSIYKNLDLNATGQNIKASAGSFHTLVVHNAAGGSVARFIKLYNKATAPIVGTDIPVMTFEIDAKINNLVVPVPSGVDFALGIGIAATTGIADANVGNPGVNEMVATVLYK